MFTGFSSQGISGSSRMGDHSWVLEYLFHFAMWPARQSVTDWLWSFCWNHPGGWLPSHFVGRRDVEGLRWVVLPSLPRLLPCLFESEEYSFPLWNIHPGLQRERWLYCWFMLLSPQTHDAVNMGWRLVQWKAILLMVSTKGMIGNGYYEYRDPGFPEICITGSRGRCGACWVSLLHLYLFLNPRDCDGRHPRVSRSHSLD